MTPGHWGVVADDFTGACDLAAQVATTGASVVVVTNPEAVHLAPPADWTVVALKSRTAPPSEAVAASTAAARALLDHGATQIYQKYCSTFDSTDGGTIGPVADALLAVTGARMTVGTPATPSVGRTVFHGHLFVGDRLVSESSMRDHPLTPMRDPDLVRVLGRQTPRQVASVGRGSADLLTSQIFAAPATHLLLDAVDDDDLRAAATAVLAVQQAGLDVIAGGGAGLATALAEQARLDSSVPTLPSTPGRDLVLVGSCSARTREQLAAFDGPVHVLDIDQVRTAPAGAVGAALRAIAAGGPRTVVTTQHNLGAVADAQARWGVGPTATAIENVLAQVAIEAVERLNVRRLLIAGGETSGAVVSALGCDTLVIGPQVAPGLPWTAAAATARRPALTLMLKSGNFGPIDLFTTAWAALP